MREITHRVNERGRYVQIVSPKRLKEILDADSEDYSPPKGWARDDEWIVEGCG